MSFPAITIDVDESAYRIRANRFMRRTIGELSLGQFSPVPRIAGPRHVLWHTEVDTTTMSYDQIQSWEAMVDRLKGGAVAIRLFDPMRALPRGKAAGKYRDGVVSSGYLIDGQYYIDGQYTIEGGATVAHVGTVAARNADSLHITGLVASDTVFYPGDLFELGGNLYSVTNLAMSDSAGETTVSIHAPLWKAAAVGDLINFRKPKARFLLAEPNGGYAERGLIHGMANLTAIEVPVLD